MVKGIFSLIAPYTPCLHTHLYLPSEQRMYKQKSEMFAVVSAHLSSYILGMDERGAFAPLINDNIAFYLPPV